MLIIDFDPQANASSAFLDYDDYEKFRSENKVISEIFTDIERIITPLSNTSGQPEITLNKLVTSVKKCENGGKIDIVLSELELSNTLEFISFKKNTRNQEKSIWLCVDRL